MTTLDLSIAMQIMAQVSQVAAFPLEAASRKQHETPTETGCFCCCRKANREAHEIVDFCEYRVIEPVGICCFTVVGGVVIGVCLVCAGACKCVACTASYINEKALKPVERGVGGGIVCVGEGALLPWRTQRRDKSCLESCRIGKRTPSPKNRGTARGSGVVCSIACVSRRRMIIRRSLCTGTVIKGTWTSRSSRRHGRIVV